MNQPFISVIIPTYNASGYILKAINSVLNQTYQNFEILIIDDASKDNTDIILEDFLQNTDSSTLFKINIIEHDTNKGVSAARNTGIKRAKGKYCAFLDADDMWEPTKLQEHILFLESNPSVGLSYDCSSFIDEEDNLLGLYQIPKHFDNLTPEYMLLRSPIGNGSSPVIRTDAIRKVLFDESLHHCEDLECWTRFYHQSGLKIAGINKLLTLYRVTSNSASANTINQVSSLQKVLLKTAQYAPELIKKYGSLALAYQYRFVARRAIKDGNTTQAFTYINKALTTDLRILAQEPLRTIITIVVAYLLKLTPNAIRTNLLFSLFSFLKKRKTV